jgi:hypothetical protein
VSNQGNDKLPIKKLLGWETLSLYLEAGVVDYETFNSLLSSVVSDNKSSGKSGTMPTQLSEPQFLDLMLRFERMVESQEKLIEAGEIDLDVEDE